MRRLVAISLAVWVLALGTGVAECLHDLTHDWEDAAVDRQDRAAGRPVKEHGVHDETNCPTHAALHAPRLSVGWVPILIALGLLIAFLTLIAAPLIGDPQAYSIDCRGPPAVLRVCF